MVPEKSALGKLAYISYFQQIEINATKLEKTPIRDVFAAVTFVDAKSPYFQPLCRFCVEHVEEVAKESALVVHDERPEQIFIRALNLHDADVDDNEDHDEGFEDEDYD